MIFEGMAAPAVHLMATGARDYLLVGPQLQSQLALEVDLKVKVLWRWAGLLRLMSTRDWEVDRAAGYRRAFSDSCSCSVHAG